MDRVGVDTFFSAGALTLVDAPEQNHSKLSLKIIQSVCIVSKYIYDL